MRIVVLPPRGDEFDECSPWRSLLKGLQEAGHEVSEFGDARKGAEALVTLNDQPEARRLQTRCGIPASKSALVALEPPVTAPAMYRPHTLSHYKHRYAPSPIWAARMGAEAFRWPQVITRTSESRGARDYAATMINGEKRSAIRGSLYGLRRQIIRSCDSQDIPLAVFGPGWNEAVPARVGAGGKTILRALQAGQSPWLTEALGDPAISPRHYKGTIQRKSTAFGHAPTAVVVENSRDYLSEKLIDAVCAGVAPIYVGPPLALFGIPPDLAIECEPNASLVCRTLRGLTESKREDVVQAGRDWLASADSRKHEISEVLTDLGHRIGHQMGG